MIDSLRQQIQHRLDQLTAEAERLRNALTALDPRSSTTTARKSAVRTAPARKPQPSAPRRRARTSARARTQQPDGASVDGSARRAGRGATKASLLAALAGADAMTAGEVAAKAGLNRATVSTTLSKLAKTGEVEKAERGYRLPAATAGAPSSL